LFAFKAFSAQLLSIMFFFLFEADSEGAEIPVVSGMSSGNEEEM
jgi:hypothetical protein